MIHFQCPSCGATFDVDDRLAGKVGRCKACGERMKVPSNGAAAPRAVAPRPNAVSVGAAPAAGPRFARSAANGSIRPQPSIGAGRPTNWLDAVTSQVALAPISMDNMKVVRSKWAALDQPSVAGPYKMASAPSLPALRPARGKAAGPITRAYRQAVGWIEKIFRWLNQSAYLVSVPFLMCMILGLAVGSHSLMVLGATAVVLLNLGRIVAGIANLAVIPFRESPMQGVLFLIPPFTFFYLAQRWPKVKKPVKRIFGPILTIGIVALAFMAEPWLKGEGKSAGSIQDQAKAGVKSLKKEVKAKIGKVSGLNVDGLDQLEQEAGDALKSLRSSETVKSLEQKVKEGGKLLGAPESNAGSAKSQ
jgi:predicted Zn finger-like uncharacterized protein